MTFRYGDIVDYNTLRFMIVSRVDRLSALGQPMWRAVRVGGQATGHMFTIGMSGTPVLRETTRAHMSLHFDPPYANMSPNQIRQLAGLEAASEP